ncbi:hypothetical protein [Streptomyces sp. NPDC060275]|uniref:hypothetical protein n=1 Tax=Streptomyces sp. NPDC060275 TaxID=3347090 RepID=UPI003657167A
MVEAVTYWTGMPSTVRHSSRPPGAKGAFIEPSREAEEAWIATLAEHAPTTPGSTPNAPQSS